MNIYTFGKFRDEVVGNLLELLSVHGELLFELLDLFQVILWNIGHRT